MFLTLLKKTGFSSSASFIFTYKELITQSFSYWAVIKRTNLAFAYIAVLFDHAGSRWGRFGDESKWQ